MAAPILTVATQRSIDEPGGATRVGQQPLRRKPCSVEFNGDGGAESAPWRRRRTELKASEDRSQAERGGCDRREFSTRCQCIGKKETERCGTTPLSSALSPSLCGASHTLFEIFSLIFVQRLVLFGLRGKPAAVALCSQFSMSSRTM